MEIMKQDQRQWVKLSELKEGDFIEADGGYACTEPGTVAVVKKDKEGLWYRCSGGRHYLDNTDFDGDTLVGFYKVDKIIKDPITLPPVISGEAGKAWACDLSVGYRQMGKTREHDACLRHWVIEVPAAHPFWHSYSLVLIHLRPMPNFPPPEIYFQDATHEMWLIALDPDKDRNQLLANGIVKGHWLHPVNFAAQFIEITDDEAMKRIENTIQLICDGKLNPDTDAREEWVNLYGDNMIKDQYSR